jgi:hypothetical protein
MEPLSDEIHGPSDEEVISAPSPARKKSSNGLSKAPPSLRPPTLMIDLLFGALMLFAFQMGDPSSTTVIPKEFELPTSNESAKKKNQKLLALKPIKEDAGDWVYELPNGKRLSADGIAKTIRTEKRSPVLLVPRDTQVQSFIDAEQPLRRLGIKAGLAVDVTKGVQK